MVEIELLLTSNETTVAFRFNLPDPIDVRPFDASDNDVTFDNCSAKLAGTSVNRFPLRSKLSIGAQAILLTSVATAELPRFRLAQLMVTVVSLPVVSAHVQPPKSAAGGQRQTSFE